MHVSISSLGRGYEGMISDKRGWCWPRACPSNAPSCKYTNVVICDRLIIAHWRSGASLKHDEAESQPWGQNITSVNNSICCFPRPAARSPNCISWSMDSILSLLQCFCIYSPLHSHSFSSLSFTSLLSRSSSWQDKPTYPSEEYSHVLHRLFLPLRSSSISLYSSLVDTIEQTRARTNTDARNFILHCLPSFIPSSAPILVCPRRLHPTGQEHAIAFACNPHRLRSSEITGAG